MSSSDSWTLDDYCRISVNLPLSSGQHRNAANAVLRDAQSLTNGMTFSSVNQPQYFGKWWEEMGDERRLHEDSHSLLLIDVPAAFGNTSQAIAVAIRDLTALLNRRYDQWNCHQAAFWITISPLLVVRSSGDQ